MAVRLRQTAVGRILTGLGIVGFGIGLIYLIIFAQFATVMFEVLDGINSVSDAAKNGRGDKAYIRTDTSGGWSNPNKTRLRLRLAHHWFSTTLVETDSFGVEEKLRWLNDDSLEVSLGFGCLVHMTQPVEQVGPVRVSYHFKDRDKELSKGCPKRSEVCAAPKTVPLIRWGHGSSFARPPCDRKVASEQERTLQPDGGARQKSFSPQINHAYNRLNMLILAGLLRDRNARQSSRLAQARLA